jgi:hypothetical protein
MASTWDSLPSLGGGGGGGSTTVPGYDDADAGVALVSGLLHRLPIFTTHELIPLPAGEPDPRSPTPAPDQEV